ncbi:hypothetical protein TorRG33x02_083300, partial [Trema orientale]
IPCKPIRRDLVGISKIERTDGIRLESEDDNVEEAEWLTRPFEEAEIKDAVYLNNGKCDN